MLGNVLWRQQQLCTGKQWTLIEKKITKYGPQNIICWNRGVVSCDNTSKNYKITKVLMLSLTSHSMQAADHLLLNWDSNWIFSAAPSSKLWFLLRIYSPCTHVVTMNNKHIWFMSLQPTMQPGNHHRTRVNFVWENQCHTPFMRTLRLRNAQ